MHQTHRKPSLKHIALLITACILLKALMIVVVAIVPVSSIAEALQLPPDLWMHNWRSLNISYDNRTVTEKLGNTFDSRWYVEISRNGYESDADLRPHFRCAPGFDIRRCLYGWPFMYPLAIRLFSLFMDSILAGLFVANLSHIVGVVLFYILALHYLGEGDALKASVLFLFYPYNILIMASFSEPLYMVLAILSWILLIKERLLWSSFFMMLAAFTRYHGIMLFPAITLIYLLGVYKKCDKRKMLYSVIRLNLFAIPLLYWMLVMIPGDTGYTLSEIKRICFETRLIPLVFLIRYPTALLLTYLALVATYHLKDTNKDLMLYSAIFMLVYIAVNANIGRFIGVLWPLFIYYGRKLDWMGVIIFSAYFTIVGGIMLELHANMVSWV